MSSQGTEMDERAVAVNHAAGYLAYQVMSWLLVLDMLAHGLRPGWLSWNGMPVDIVAVLGAGGIAHLAYQLRHRTVGSRRTGRIAFGAALAVLVSIAVVLVMMYVR